MNGPNGVFIEFPETGWNECRHPKPFQYVPKNDKVAMETQRRKEDYARAHPHERLFNGLKKTLDRVWAMDSAAIDKLNWPSEDP